MNRTYACLSAEELIEVLEAKRNNSLREVACVAGYVDFDNDEVILFNTSHNRQIIHMSAFETSGDGTAPDFNKFEIIDYGGTIKFGEYEAAYYALI